jgi:hypothetical protein
MADNKTKSFYLAPDVIKYLETHENASAEVNRLVRRQMMQDAEEEAFQRINGVPLTEERRRRARSWSREQLAAAAERTADSREDLNEIRRQMGWAA